MPNILPFITTVFVLKLVIRLVRDKSGRLVRDEDSGGDVSSSSGSFGLPRSVLVLS